MGAAAGRSRTPTPAGRADASGTENDGADRISDDSAERASDQDGTSGRNLAGRAAEWADDVAERFDGDAVREITEWAREAARRSHDDESTDDHVEGEDLARRIAARGGAPAERAAAYEEAVARLVDRFHHAGDESDETGRRAERFDDADDTG
ncbi:hypothetical protein WEH80_34025 [Actinomycetes bacterium KLBMP 9759]